MPFTSRATLWLLVAVITTGCGGVRGASSPARSLTYQRLDAADALARGARYGEAREAYASILADGPGADRALLGLARLALDPSNLNRNERLATEYLDRLIAEYPESAWLAEAWSWRSLLRSIERLQREARRHQHEIERLRRDLHREQQDTVRLREERERLRQIDAELERPRSSHTLPFQLSP